MHNILFREVMVFFNCNETFTVVTFTLINFMTFKGTFATYAGLRLLCDVCGQRLLSVQKLNWQCPQLRNFEQSMAHKVRLLSSI